MNNIKTASNQAPKFYDYEFPEFRETRKMYQQSVTYMEYPLPFDKWASAPASEQAVLLFLAFYEQIILAWRKCAGADTPEATGVDEANAVVLKLMGMSVKRLTKATRYDCQITPDTYNSRYMYRTFVNAFNSLNYERSKVDSTYRHEKEAERGEVQVIRQHQNVGGDWLDLFDTVSDDGGMGNTLTQREFWAAIEDLNLDGTDVIERLLDGKEIRDEDQSDFNRLRAALAPFTYA